jgi:hypothetical protein
MQNNIEERIRERAYAIWSNSGRTEGQADQHWLVAEREVLTTVTTALPTAPAKKPRSRATAPRAAKRAAAR